LPSSSLLVPLLGEQRPRLESRPDAVASYGDLAVDFVTAAGMKLDDWQEYVLWAWHDINEDGDWAASECGLLVSRQNGKSEILIAYDLVRLFLFPMEDGRRRNLLHTAHEVKTATESFEKLAGIIANNDVLMDLVEHVYTANGRKPSSSSRGPVSCPRWVTECGSSLGLASRVAASARATSSTTRRRNSPPRTGRR
jgi:hypothetical protein